jgi:hypothetical protein
MRAHRDGAITARLRHSQGSPNTMANPQLSEGVIRKIHDTNDTTEKPLVQVWDVKRIGQPGQSTNERFRIVISDGINYQQAMLATQQVVPLRPVPVLPTPPI